MLQIKSTLDEILEKLPEEFVMVDLMAKVPPEDRTPYVIVAFQECERMNLLTSEIKRSLKELDFGLKVQLFYYGMSMYIYRPFHFEKGHFWPV